MCGQTQGEGGGSRCLRDYCGWSCDLKLTFNLQPYNGVSYTSVQLDASRRQLIDGGKPLDLSDAVMNFIPASCVPRPHFTAPAPCIAASSRMRSITWKMATGMAGDAEAAVGGTEAAARVPITLTHVQYTEGRS